MTTERQNAAKLRLARPLATAYILGLVSSTSPRLIKILVLATRRKLNLSAAWTQFTSVLRQALSPYRFPTFCAVLVGGSTLLQSPFSYFIIKTLLYLRSPSRPPHRRAVRVLARFFSAVVAAFLSFRLLNSRPHTIGLSGTPQPPNRIKDIRPDPLEHRPEIDPKGTDDDSLNAQALPSSRLAGRTMDLTLFAVVRTLDIVINGAWNWLLFESSAQLETIARSATPLLFCCSAATIMHSWFYSPSRLPQSYNAWISSAAGLDHRLLVALRHARYGTWGYGKEGMAPLLGSMCRDYGLPEELGDPAVTIPIPCQLVHMGCGRNCEKHALVRFWRGWLFAAQMYAPLQVFVLARHMRKRAGPGNKYAGLDWTVLLRALEDMTRSSAFLGAFIALFYYGVCLSRTRLGPKVFSYKAVTPQMWDSGLCVLGGCLLCGLSIFIEQPRKRLEILFFVLPRAAATWFPRRYLPEHQWKEHLAFTLSAAIVLTTAQESPKRVRGVLGSVLNTLLKT